MTGMRSFGALQGVDSNAVQATALGMDQGPTGQNVVAFVAQAHDASAGVVDVEMTGCLKGADAEPGQGGKNSSLLRVAGNAWYLVAQRVQVFNFVDGGRINAELEAFVFLAIYDRCS